MPNLGISLPDAQGKQLTFNGLMYDNYTPNGFSFDSNKPEASKTPLGKKLGGQVIFRLIGTPAYITQQFYSFVGFQLDLTFPLTMRSTRFIYGNKRLYNDFLIRMERANTIHLPAYAPIVFKRDLIKLSALLEKNSSVSRITDFQSLMRPVDILIHGLSMALQQNQNPSTLSKIEKLFEVGIIDYSQMKGLSNSLNFALWIKLYLHLKFNEQKIDITEELPFYKSYQCMQSFMKHMVRTFYERIEDNEIVALKKEQSLSFQYNQSIFFRQLPFKKQLYDPDHCMGTDDKLGCLIPGNRVELHLFMS